ncbi:MAG: LPO_1073/Vpar_1526 family protein [Terriglobales bacterium]
MAKQNQKAGDNSANIQANSITVNQGLSVVEVRQMALDVFRSNFFELAGEAKDIARHRAEEITEAFLQKLQKEYIKGMAQAQDPDFQYALYTVQKEHARSGDKELASLLVDLLVDRTKHDSRTILQIVLNESLSVAPKLTTDQLAALSIIFLVRYTVHNGVNGHEALWKHFDATISPFAGQITNKAACYQHLEYSGCGTVGLGSVQLSQAFREHYAGLFSKGFDDTQFQGKQLSIPSNHPLFIPCLNDSTRLQPNGMNENVIRQQCNRTGVSEDDAAKAVALHTETLMNDDEIKAKIITARPYMARVFDLWSSSANGTFHAYERRNCNCSCKHQEERWRIHGSFDLD